MTLAVEQAKAEKSLFWLFEVELTYRIEGATWTQASSPNTNAWWMDHSSEREPSRVFQMLRSTHVITEFDEEVSIADCHANAGSWFYDASTGRLYVHMSGSDAPDTASKYYLKSNFWLYFSTHQFAAPDTLYDPGGFLVEPRFSNAPAEVSQEINDFSEVGLKETWGSVVIANGDGRYDTALTAYVWHGCRYNFKVGAKGDAYADLITINRGRTGSVGWNDNTIELRLEDQLQAEDDY